MNDELMRQVGTLQTIVDGLVKPEVGGVSAISQTTLTGSVASVTFDLTDYQQFRHLLLIANARTDRAASVIDYATVRFNADAGANYYYIVNSALNAVVSSATATAVTAIRSIILPGSTATANNFGGGFLLIPNYTDTNQVKTVLGLSLNQGADIAISIQSMFFSGYRLNTAAITSMTILPNTGPNFVANSVFAIYGIY